MFNFKPIYFVIFIVISSKTNADISDKRLCVDEKCSVLISEGKTTQKYSSIEPNILSFRQNENVKIYSYGAGTRPELLGVEIKGKRGYINKNFVREINLVKPPKKLVDTETFSADIQVKTEINPEPTKQSYQIIEGTKVPVDPQNFEIPSGTEAPLSSFGTAKDGLSRTSSAVPENPDVNQAVPNQSKILNKKDISDRNSDAENDDDGDNSDENEKNRRDKDDSNGSIENSSSIEKLTEEVNGTEETVRKSDKEDTIIVAKLGEKQSGTFNEALINISAVNPAEKAGGKSDLEGPSSEKLSDVTNGAEEKKNNREDTDVDAKTAKKKSEPSNEAVNNNLVENTAEKTGGESDLGTLSSKKLTEVVNGAEEIVKKSSGGNTGIEAKIEELSNEATSNNSAVNITENTAAKSELGRLSSEKLSEVANRTEEIVKESDEKKSIDAKTEENKYKAPNEAVNNNSVLNITEKEPLEKSNSGDKNVDAVSNNNIAINTTNETLKKMDITIETVASDSSQNEDSKSTQLPMNSQSSNEDTSTLSREKNNDVNLLQDDSNRKRANEVPDIRDNSTQIPIDNEGNIPPAANLDSITPNPVEVESTLSNLIVEKNVVETSSQDEQQDRHKNLEPQFKDTEEENQGKNEDTLAGLTTTVFPIFNAAQTQKSVNNDQKFDGVNAQQFKEPFNRKSEMSTQIDDSVLNSENQPLDLNPLSNNEPGDEMLNAESVKPDFIDAAAEASDSKNGNIVQEDENDDEQNEEVESSSDQTPSEYQAESSGGIFSKIMSIFGVGSGEEITKNIEDADSFSSLDADGLVNTSSLNNEDFCFKENQNCPPTEGDAVDEYGTVLSASKFMSLNISDFVVDAFTSDMFLYLITTAASVIFFLFGSIILDKCRRERPLIARINKLEQRLLATTEENRLLQEKASLFAEEKTQLIVETVPNEVVEELNQKLAEMSNEKLALEEQIQALEKELDMSTEVGIELNKIISEMLNSNDGSEIIKENIEQMQKKLLEQQDTINTVNEALSLRETENHELRLELDISNKKVTGLQAEVDKMVDKLLKIEEERDQQNGTLEKEIVLYQTKLKEAGSKERTLNTEIQVLKQKLAELQRVVEIKGKEYGILKESMEEIKSVKNNNEAFKTLLEVSEVKAQLSQLASENSKYSEQLSQEREANVAHASKIQSLTQEVTELREKYEKADKEKVEIKTKLEVLNNYFKEKEEQMLKEIGKYESLWVAREGEATSTTERIRYMQEELQNYKGQNESLKQEIVNQEVELKSQISMLEKKAHENWVLNRQTERKLEEARQEAAQLRNRLTLRERAIADGNSQMGIFLPGIQSPLHQNGELPLSPPPLDPNTSPPPLFNPRDHLTKSPPIHGMPPLPPFLPPAFIPPPPLDAMMSPPMGEMGGMPPPFMPPFPPGLFPGDHRPPPLGRMSSPPPVGGRYSPESTVYSEYDRYRRSPTPPYDLEYAASPPPIRGYSPYEDRLRDDRREYRKSQIRSNGRSSKGPRYSSGSENDSLGKGNKKAHRKV